MARVAASNRRPFELRPGPSQRLHDPDGFETSANPPNLVERFALQYPLLQ